MAPCQSEFPVESESDQISGQIFGESNSRSNFWSYEFSVVLLDAAIDAMLNFDDEGYYE